jgi:hypothetical protein
MDYSINPQEIRTDIEKQGYMVANTRIWNIEQYRPKLPLTTFFVEIKPATNNKDTFNVEYIQQCKIDFQQPKHKRDIIQCVNCQKYGQTKSHCPIRAGRHLTNQCHRKNDRVMSDVSSVMEIILRITRSVLYTRTYKRKRINLSVRK